MRTVIYTEPHKTDKPDCWLIGWSKTQFEKAKCNIFHRGSYESAVEKIASLPGKKFIRR